MTPKITGEQERVVRVRKHTKQTYLAWTQGAPGPVQKVELFWIKRQTLGTCIGWFLYIRYRLIFPTSALQYNPLEE